MHDPSLDMTGLTQGLATKADKIRALGRAGYPRADIARFLDIRYQHVRNTLEAANIPMRDGDGARPNIKPESLRSSGAETGLAEASAQFERDPCPTDGYFALSFAPDGRLVVPAALREAMMLDPKGRVTAHVEDGELRVISPLAAIRRVQRIAQKYKKPGQSVVDEFLAERRALWGEE